MNAQEAIESLRLKFTSGNSVPVTRSQITREEFDAIEAATALQSSGGEVEPYSISWADYWIGQGNFPLANDFETFELANAWLQANRTASPAQPSGFVLVPVEPTRKMCDDAVHAAVHGSHGSPWFPHAWRAALKAAAAPAPIEQEG